MSDNAVWVALTELAACLCEQIRKDDLTPVCFCGVLPGAVVAHDYVGTCDEYDGMAWTRLASGYPAAAVGQMSATVGNCNSGIGVDIELGMLRSAPTMQEDGRPPDEEAQAHTADLQIADMLAMWKAVACCFENREYILRDYRPFGPQGFAVGGTYMVTVAL